MNIELKNIEQMYIDKIMPMLKSKEDHFSYRQMFVSIKKAHLEFLYNLRNYKLYDLYSGRLLGTSSAIPFELDGYRINYINDNNVYLERTYGM